MNKTGYIFSTAALCLVLGGCAAGSTDAHVAAAGGDIPQFFLGLWHGIIAPFTLLAEIINKLVPGLLPWKPHFFETGAGTAYDLGFFLTVTGSLHGILYALRRRRA